MADNVDNFEQAMSRPSTPEQDNHNVVTEILDNEGDVWVEGKLRRFKASGKVMSLASNYFKTALKPRWVADGREPTALIPATLRHHDDDDFALGALLCLLHYRTTIEALDPTPEQVAKIVGLADQYLCLHVVQDIYKSWISSHSFEDDTEADLVSLAKAAFTLSNDLQFSKATERLIKGFDSFAIMGTVRCALLQAEIHLQRQHLLSRLRRATEYALQQVGEMSPVFDTPRWYCYSCDCEFGSNGASPWGNKLCQLCGADSIQQTVCEASRRVRDLTSFLEQWLGYLPPTKLETLELYRCHVANEYLLEEFDEWGRHPCTGYNCPIQVALRDLATSFRDAIDSTRGIDLVSFKKHVKSVRW
ncbi:MAG: hypothetical protein LQ340_007887 [Diploschistes diacapsis]|nr:MAG: hypothetical protein LQ340_007887 [Diploschistes diacapsis]